MLGSKQLIMIQDGFQNCDKRASIPKFWAATRPKMVKKSTKKPSKFFSMANSKIPIFQIDVT